MWKDLSPFDTVGVYIGVNSGWDNRADKVQSNLTSQWVSTVIADGWRIIPIYVGRQAPKACQTASFHGLSSDPGAARNQGFEAAADAIASLGRLGIGAGNPIYYDMEAYRPGCATAVLAFLDGWTEGLHASGLPVGCLRVRAASVMWDMSRSFGVAGFDAARCSVGLDWQRQPDLARTTGARRRAVGQLTHPPVSAECRPHLRRCVARDRREHSQRADGGVDGVFAACLARARDVDCRQ